MTGPAFVQVDGRTIAMVPLMAPAISKGGSFMIGISITRLAFAGALLAASGGAALAFNPQPDPPGDIMATHWQINNLPMCATGEHIGSATGGAGTGKFEMRKAGGEQTHYTIGRTSTGGKCLNPQPLPPG
jgi:hypothetical protein